MRSIVRAHQVAPRTFGGSPMVYRSSAAGSSRTIPSSNSPIAFGACVRFATTNAMSGRRMPTKTRSPSRISRAACATMSSPGERSIRHSPDGVDDERDDHELHQRAQDADGDGATGADVEG